jgi:flagellar biosynthesis protein FlhF
LIFRFGIEPAFFLTQVIASLAALARLCCATIPSVAEMQCLGGSKHLRMKSYFANSVQMAMEQARRELGSDATLVTSRSAGPEARHLGEYEVVFATERPEAGATDGRRGGSPATSAPTTAQPRSGAPDSILAEIRELRRLFQAWRQASIRSAGQPQWIIGNPELEEVYAELIQAEVDPDLAQQLLAAVQKRLHPTTISVPPEPAAVTRQAIKVELSHQQNSMEPAAVRTALCAEIQSSFRVDTDLGTPGNGPRMVALVGPPGAGKTATIAKLAVKYGLSSKKPTLLLSLDTLRVAASEQLRWYASILGIHFQVVETSRALAQTLEEHRGKDLIFIDTPGLTTSDLDGGCDVAEFLAGRNDIQKHLVLPASMRFTDLARISSAYDVFRPSRLIFTRMDETGTFGPLLCEAVGSGRPISFLTTGQRVPEDLEPADKTSLTNRLLPHNGRPAHRALAAA